MNMHVYFSVQEVCVWYLYQMLAVLDTLHVFIDFTLDACKSCKSYV